MPIAVPPEAMGRQRSAYVLVTTVSCWQAALKRAIRAVSTPVLIELPEYGSLVITGSRCTQPLRPTVKERRHHVHYVNVQSKRRADGAVMTPFKMRQNAFIPVTWAGNGRCAKPSSTMAEDDMA